MTRRRKILVADLLCGAGGSSTGCERALNELGLEMELVCVNHWPTAIETHRLNHPQARHHVQDISTVRPHLIVPEGYLDLLMASPTCTHHSVARGGKPTSDQQRSDPWHIITWFTELRVKRAIIENVWEFISWGPVDPRTGKPIPSRKGEYFRAWVDTIKRLGATGIEYRKLNAANYGDATTRQRFIMMIRFDRKPIIWPDATHMRRPDEGLALFPSLKPWKPAREIIDWDIKGRSIFNRKKPLAAKTLARIYAGAVKFNWPEPYLVILRNHMAAQSVDVPIPTLAAHGQHIGLAQPVILSQHNSGAPRSADDPLPTITTGGAGAESHPGCARPMLVTVAHGTDARDADPFSRRSHDIEDPLGAIHGDGAAVAVVEPFVLSQASGGAPRGVSEPIPTQTTGGAGGSHALISPYYGSGSGETCTPADDPLPTVTSKGRFGMVVPVTHSLGGNAARSTDDPVPTMTTAKGGEFAFVTAQFGEREGQLPRVHDLDTPAPTGLTLGKGGLIEGTETYDILFRMLEPHELAAAMGFTTEDQAYEFAGTKTDQIKQIGNAVSVAKMKACVRAIMADAVPRRRSRPEPQAAQEAA